MRTVDAVKGQWGKVFNDYKLPPITGKHHFKGKCPVCGQKGKFRIDNKDGSGSYICVCGSGSGWRLLELTQRKDFRTLAREVDLIIGNSHTVNHMVKPESEKTVFRERVLQKYQTLSGLKDTNAQAYFNRRGLTVLPANNVRFCASEREYCAIYSLATDSKNTPCYLHRTILDGDKKAAIDAPKKMNSLQDDHYVEYAQSIAVRLFPLTSTLGIAEGIETALSCTQIYKCHTWSTLNATFMKKFIAPAGVEHLIIFADRDKNGTGQAAAYWCANRNLLSNNDVKKVSIRWPEKGDFNDVLVHGLKVYEDILTR